jgi:hypothetical protein
MKETILFLRNTELVYNELILNICKNTCCFAIPGAIVVVRVSKVHERETDSGGKHAFQFEIPSIYSTSTVLYVL